ncbi:tetratricopeptide repeat protein [Sphingomonas sp. MMS24-JH45]
MSTMVMAASTAVAMTLAIPAAAQERTGYVAIAGGDLAGAQATIERERVIFPNRPELMVSVAAVYARTGRVVEARQAYADVLAGNWVDLELGDGRTMSSHDIARRGLARLDTTIAAR